MAEAPSVVLVTDGACSGNPGPGGWACVLRREGGVLELSGGEAHTTNNRMEMLAALRGLEELEESSRVELWTDSQYLKNGITSWIHGWMRKGWRTSSGEPVKNEDLWRALWEENGRHQVEWRWVKGHAGHADNERCDRLAVAAVERARQGDTAERRGLGQATGGGMDDSVKVDAGSRTRTRSSSAKDCAAPAQQEAALAEKGRNLELKIAVRALDDIKRRAGTLGGKLDSRLTQDDQFYTCADGTRLKLRREVQHLPDGQSRQHAELIRYLREDTATARLSSYERESVADPEALHSELAARHGVGVAVRKGREVVLIGRTRLHLDAVAGLGTFVELELVLREGETPEAARAELEHIIRGLGLYGQPVEPRAYADLLSPPSTT
jgi:ribonuclease HI